VLIKNRILDLMFLFREMKLKWLIYFALFVNLAGTVYGWYYYKAQLIENSPLLWPIITDSPNSTFFFVISVILMLKGKKSDFISYFAGANLIKYGLWTVSVLIYHSDFFFAPGRYLLYSGIFITHSLLVLESIPLILSVNKLKSKTVILTFLWLGLNDFFDYVLDTHPYIPERNIEIIAAYTVFLTFFSILLGILIHKASKVFERYQS